ncbi:hypothetical protein KRR39_01000 [Nocardioides panacis]|uniref:Uncharacterized protein n=1 Tax=Nocardioides panacis TaxID=2849501 RepID=A0A975T072_9ACTN|nr:hypothetical protein [Nocardioides panacis]QWZ08484.1 hypothetical protein KRR39_01000 [Nocardioides panacis]
MTDQPTWHTAWVSALDELELTLEETTRLLAGGDVDEVLSATPWSPPELAAPLPSDLLVRAQGLLARQQELMGLTAAAMTGNRDDVVLLGRVNSYAGSRRTEPAVYLDVRA